VSKISDAKRRSPDVAARKPGATSKLGMDLWAAKRGLHLQKRAFHAQKCKNEDLTIKNQG